jgi:hypothetical protein
LASERLYITPVRPSIPKCSSQVGDVKPEAALVDGDVLPDACEKVALGDELPGVLDQDT